MLSLCFIFVFLQHSTTNPLMDLATRRIAITSLDQPKKSFVIKRCLLGSWMPFLLENAVSMGSVSLPMCLELLPTRKMEPLQGSWPMDCTVCKLWLRPSHHHSIRKRLICIFIYSTTFLNRRIWSRSRVRHERSPARLRQHVCVQHG